MPRPVTDPDQPREVPVFGVAAAVSVLALVLGLVNASFGSPRSSAAMAQVDAVVVRAPAGRPLPDGFLGLSLEYWAIPAYAGSDPAAVNPVLVNLVRRLAPGQTPILRIGGDSADWTWWPVPGMNKPPGVSLTLGSDWLAETVALRRALGARLLLGLNLQADSSELAAMEARELLAGLGQGAVSGFELGNEPSLYGVFPWYRTSPTHGVLGRPKGYSFADFLADFARIGAALPAAAPLAGPSTGAPAWLAYLGRFLAAAPRVRIVTVHHYPLQLCYTSRRSSRYPTIAHMLAPAASTGLADEFARAVATAHARGLPVRIDELNTVSCGAVPKVSNSFASALWALDALFEFRRVGVDGVQMHTFPGAGYELFKFKHSAGRWTASVAPEYYGLAMFATAAPAGSRLLAVSAPDGGGMLKIWATSAPDRRVRVLVINKDAVHGRTVRVRIPASAGPARLERLEAPSLADASGVRLGGRTLGAATSTGNFLGARRIDSLAPDGGRYVVDVPPASAALISVASR